MASNAREKIRLISSADTGHFYTTTKNKPEHPRQDENKKIRSCRPQACRLPGRQNQVSPAPPEESRALRRSSEGALARKKQR